MSDGSGTPGEASSTEARRVRTPGTAALVPAATHVRCPSRSPAGWGVQPSTRELPRSDKRKTRKSARRAPGAQSRPALPSQLLVQSPAGGSGTGRGRKRRGRSGPGRGARRRGPALGFRPGSRRPGCQRPQQRGLRVGGAGRCGPGHPLRARPAERPLTRRREEGGGGLDVDDRAARDGKCLIKAAARPGPRDSPLRFPQSARGGRGWTPDRSGLPRILARDSSRTDRGSGQTSDGPRRRRTPA